MKICVAATSDSLPAIRDIYENQLDWELVCCDRAEEILGVMSNESCELLLLDAQLFSEEAMLHLIHRVSSVSPVVVLVEKEAGVEREELVLKGAQDVLAYGPLGAARAEHTAELAVLRHRREVHLHQAMQQSQKMEAVGRMASGIAHDYNNLLTIILNDAVLARDSLPAESPVMEDVLEQIATIKRAAGLTRRLLVMSRVRSVQRDRVDLLQVVGSMEKMFRHVTGDRVMLTFDHQVGALPIHGDIIQLEQALLNLVINACDAIWYEGTLKIETGMVDLTTEMDTLYFGEPESSGGCYAMVRVTDSGCGIDEDDLAHIFEPFFTTKAEGSGTGLGLYQVYSTVKQHDGCIAVRSTRGEGSAITLYFKCDDTCESSVEEVSQELPKGSESILLVEDDDTVRKTTARLLKRLGYHVTEAPGAEEALAMKAGVLSEIDLLLTDVMMPRVNGLQLANRLKEDYPALRILLASGYPESRLTQHGLLPDKYAFISKPFFRDRLARLIRTLLDQ